MNFVSHSLNETQKIADDFLKSLMKRDSKSATIVGLHGDLGSGKTTFTQCVVRSLGISESITSPTFLIIKTYNLQRTTYNKLIHIDVYRLKTGEELLKLGWQELVADPQSLIFLEWPERVSEILPPDYIKLEFEFVDETARKITFE